MSSKKEGPKINTFLDLSFLAFVLVVYYVARFFLADRYGVNNYNMGKILALVAGIVLIGFQIGAAINVSRIHCGSPIIGKSVMSTLIPNFFYMGSILTLLYMFPGFKAPFSNTFGYIAISPFVKSVINDLLLSNKDKSTGLLKKLYQDESVLVNLLTPDEEGFQRRLENLTNSTKLLDNKWKGTNAEKDLYNLVVIKDSIAEFIWLVLGLAITISTTYNSITTTSDCGGGVSEDTAVALKQKAESKMKGLGIGATADENTSDDTTTESFMNMYQPNKIGSLL